MNLGLPQLPEWVLRVILWCAVLGFLTCVLAVGLLIFWLFKHLTWIP